MKCYRCNLDFDSDLTARLHQSLTGHDIEHEEDEDHTIVAMLKFNFK